MNKTFTLSSVGQNPENFSCSLSKTEFIPPNHQIALLNMSVDAHSGSGHHYVSPGSTYDLTTQTATIGTGGYDFNGVVFFFQIVAQTLSVSTYSGSEGHDYQINLWNGAVRYIRMTSQTTFNYYVVETDPHTLTGVFDPTASPNTFTFSSGTVWELLTPATGVPLNPILTVTFTNYSGSNNHTFLVSVSDGTSFYLTRTSFRNYTHHSTDGAVSALTAVINDGVNPHILTLSNGDTYTAAGLWTLNTPSNVANGSLPRAEFFVSLDNLPIENHISNNTFQSIVPSVYTHHNRFDSETDESIVPHHLIYHKLNNKGYLRIGKIDVSIRDNITGDILHNTTLNISTNLTLHIKPI